MHEAAPSFLLLPVLSLLPPVLLQVKATEPPDLGVIAVSCPVRQAAAIQVTLTNPTDKPLTLRAQYSCPSLVGPSSFAAPPKEPAVFECYYAPLLLKNEEGVVRLISHEVMACRQPV